MTGRLIAVVGPSGAGKDTLMRALYDACPGLRLVGRTITRPAGSGGEDHDAVSRAEFDRRRASGGFCLHWSAHGLQYGIPVEVCWSIAQGDQLLVNLSRGVLCDAARLFPRLSVLNVSARPETLARRLEQRGRETRTDIADRLDRAVSFLPPGLSILNVDNDGDLRDTIRTALALLPPQKA